MTLETLLADKQLPAHWKKTLKSNRTEILGNALVLFIITEDIQPIWVVFTYDDKGELKVKLE